MPLPSHRLARAAIRSLNVDSELSSLVQRRFFLAGPDGTDQDVSLFQRKDEQASEGESSVLCTEYRATTNRMLRVAVNGFMESLSLVIEVMEQLDVDVLFS